MVRKYIKRDFTDHAYTTEYLSDEDEYIKFEIFSFDPKYTKPFSVEAKTLKGENVTKTNFKSYTCYRSKDKINPMEFTLSYKVQESGVYRIDFLYEKNSEMYINKEGELDKEYNTSKDLVGWYDIFKAGTKSEHKAKVFTETLPKNANKKVKQAFEKAKKRAIKVANSSNVDKSSTAKNLKFEGENNALKRKTIFRTLNKGNYKIEFGVPHNCYVYGAIIRKIVKFYGTNDDETGSNLMFTSATLTMGEVGKSSTLECEVGYDDAFECETSPSGLYIEYMDECNLYVKNNEGNIERIFGGYVSTPLPDNSREEITIHCADRLKDGENKYILDQLLLQNGEKNDREYPNSISFDKYAEVLRYLCRLYEVTLKSNANDVIHIENEKFRNGFTITFGKKKDVKKIPVTNGEVTINKNNVTLRNKPSGKKKQVWNIYKAKKTPINITNYTNFHITCGLGNVKTPHKSKTTTKVDTSDTTAGGQKFGKCGVSQDKKYIMGIGQYSGSKGTGGLSYHTIYKRIFENKCPHCGGKLVWDSGRSDSNCVHCGRYKHSKREWGNISETEFTCTSCCADYDAITGYEKDSPWKRVKPVTKPVKSSKAEQNKLHRGEMVASPGGNIAVTAEDIFKSIRKACKGWTHSTGTGTTASYLEKHGVGDCWAWSAWIGKQLKKYKVNYKIVQYATSGSPNGTHRSVLYQNSKGKYVDFPYRKYNFPKNTRNTSGSKSGRLVEHWKAGGRINQATSSGSTTKTQTVEVTTTTGFDKDKPFQCYIDLVYSTKAKSDRTPAKLSDKKQHLYLNFTQIPQGNNTKSGLSPIWVNDTMKRFTLEDIIPFIKNGRDIKVYLHAINFIAPVIKTTNDNKETTWYTFDKATKDYASCKMYLSKIEFNNADGSKPSDLSACGKTINELMKSMVDEAEYSVVMEYGEHRCDDKIHFKLNNSNQPVFTATEGDNNNILEWGNISYNPANELFNMSRCVFKQNNDAGLYNYVETKNFNSILKYQEQCTLITENEKIGEKEAYWNARHNEKYNPEQTYTFTITVKGFPDVKFGEYVEVIANMKKLNTLKEVNSIKLKYDVKDKPVLQTELGLGELAPDIQVDKTIKKLRDSAKTKTTYFFGTASPISNEDIYEWED